MLFDASSDELGVALRHVGLKDLRDATSETLSSVLNRVIRLQRPVARANVDRLRRVHPEKSPSELLELVDRDYLAVVSATGFAAGAAAANGDGRLGVAAALLDAVAFTEATVLYALTVAEIHDVHPEDHERMRLVVMAIMVGEEGTRLINSVAGSAGRHWGKQIVQRIPMSAINRINARLAPRFITKYGTKQGVLVLSKQVPRGIGALLGGGGNLLIGCALVRSAREFFGDAPAAWPSG
jgi:hypothetical protein